ncbi:MAG: hypothetical protein JW703_02130, partial [Candidatus Diapherotrites archaeon]|nr:hypothetical protein [Candidatus Diapherotrites archaeon]
MEMFEIVAKELFKRQIKYENGRYILDVPLKPSERMNWFASKYWAILQNKLNKEFGSDYYIYEYYAGKLYGHLFGSRIANLVKTKSLVAPMLALIVKQFGYGNIKPIKTDYKENWLSFEFADLPIAREHAKLFGFSETPVDFVIAGLVAGSAEQLLERKFIALESSCLGMGNDKCVIEVLSKENFEKKISTVTNK